MTQDEINQLIVAFKQVFATKTEVVTKEDLKSFATKDDLKALATKEDLRNLVTNDQFQKQMKKVVTKDELSEQIKRLYKMLEYLPSKNHFDKRMDELMTEIEAVREKQTLISSKVSEHSDSIAVIQ